MNCFMLMEDIFKVMVVLVYVAEIVMGQDPWIYPPNAVHEIVSIGTITNPSAAGQTTNTLYTRTFPITLSTTGSTQAIVIYHN